MISYTYIWAYLETANTKSTYPSMRNCPGAGRPTWMESFNRSSSAAQLSTKLVTGILRERAAMAMKTASSPSGIPRFPSTSQFSRQILWINIHTDSLVFHLILGVLKRHDFQSKVGAVPMSYSTIKISFPWAGDRFSAGFLGGGRKVMQN